ncbi:MAG TPA: hypothetical protein VGB77_12085 [Abditibacteriaceae bacterium]|jgi:hypothetical protein
MKTRKASAVLLVTAFTTSLAGLTVSQTKAREAHAREMQLHQGQPHHAPYRAESSEISYFDDFDMAEIAEMARFYKVEDKRPRGRFFPDPENLTPQQREQMFRKFMEDRLRESLTRHGFAQEELQNAVVEFSRVVESDRRAIREKSGKLREGMDQKASDAQIANLLADLRRSVSYAKMRRDRGRKVLNAKISFSKKPRLDAVLSLSGLGGDESPYLMSSFGGRSFGRRGFGGHGGR